MGGEFRRRRMPDAEQALGVGVVPRQLRQREFGENKDAREWPTWAVPAHRQR